MADPYILSGSYALLGTTGATNPNFGATGRVARDILCIWNTTANQALGSVPAGWTLLEQTAGLGTPAAAGSLKGYFLYKVSDGTEGTVTIDDSGDYNIGVRFVVRDADPAAPINVILPGDAAASTSLSCPSVTTTKAGCLIVNCVATDRDGVQSANFSAWTNAGLTGMAEIFDEGAASGTGAAIGVGAGLQAAAGSTGNTTVTTATSHVAVFMTIAFAPVLAEVAIQPATHGHSGAALPASAPGDPAIIAPGTHGHAGGALTAVNLYPMPVITRPAGGGDIDVAATIITGGLTPWPTIAFTGDPESNDNISGTKWEGFFGSVDFGIPGRGLTGTIDHANWRVSTPPANNKWYYRLGAGIGDLYAWSPFDNRSVAGSLLTFWNDDPFADADVQVANIPPVPYDEFLAWLTAWDSSPYMHRPAAATALGVSGVAPLKYAYYDFPDLVSPDGVEVGGCHAFALKITNAAAQPADGSRKRRIWHKWVHAGEWGGLRAMMRRVERLLTGTGAVYDTLRDDFEHVFLFINTAGMVGAMARGVVEAGDVGEDPNRRFPIGTVDVSTVTDQILSVSASVNALLAEWGVDSSGKLDADGHIAYHSHTAASAQIGTYATGMSTAESYFVGRMQTYFGTALHNYGGSSDGSSTVFARTAQRNPFGVTLEWSYAFGNFLVEVDTSADTIDAALVDTYVAGYFPPVYAVQLSAGTHGHSGAALVLQPHWQAALQAGAHGHAGGSLAATYTAIGAIAPGIHGHAGGLLAAYSPGAADLAPGLHGHAGAAMTAAYTAIAAILAGTHGHQGAAMAAVSPGDAFAAIAAGTHGHVGVGLTAIFAGLAALQPGFHGHGGGGLRVVGHREAQILAALHGHQGAALIAAIRTIMDAKLPPGRIIAPPDLPRIIE